MRSQMKEAMSERRRTVRERMYRFRDEPVESMREVALTTADGIKSLKPPVRALTRSGVKLATVSENAVRSLIELQSEAITSAMTAAATRLERAAKADTVVELVLDQVGMLGATRERLVDEGSRAVEILKVAGRDLRKVGTHLYEQVFEPVEEELPKAVTTRVRKAKRVVRKAGRTVRKTTASVH